MKTILITGGAGFIGSHTSLVLLQQFYKIIILDDLSNSSYESIAQIKKILVKQNKVWSNNLDFIEGDIRDESLLIKIFEKYKATNNLIQGVIHFAGAKSVNESVINPIKFWDINFNGTLTLVKIMSRFSCKKLVFSSSATVYGSKYTSSLKEQLLNSPINPYGNTKNSIEIMLKDLSKSDPSWDIISLRYFNPIGAHPSGLLGEKFNYKNNNLFPNLCNVAIGNNNLLEIYGKNWPTRDGTCLRDFIHVMDVAEGHINAIDFLFNSKIFFTCINLGTGRNTSILELINVFEKTNNVTIKYKFNNRRSGDAAVLFADVKLAKNLLNWESKRNLEDMCRDGWKWYLSNISN